MQVEQVAPQTLLLQIESEVRTGRVRVPITGQMIVGRSAEEASHGLGLDLTEYGGASQGVSRFHAAFCWDEDNQMVYVEDLGSTSGTRINGLPLEAHRPYTLRSGDELEFGRVRVTVRFEKTAR